MSVKHMDRYLEELEWRFNNRGQPLHLPRRAAADHAHRSPGVPDADRVLMAFRMAPDPFPPLVKDEAEPENDEDE